MDPVGHVTAGQPYVLLPKKAEASRPPFSISAEGTQSSVQDHVEVSINGGPQHTNML